MTAAASGLGDIEKNANPILTVEGMDQRHPTNIIEMDEEVQHLSNAGALGIYELVRKMRLDIEKRKASHRIVCTEPVSM